MSRSKHELPQQRSYQTGFQSPELKLRPNSRCWVAAVKQDESVAAKAELYAGEHEVSSELITDLVDARVPFADEVARAFLKIIQKN